VPTLLESKSEVGGNFLSMTELGGTGGGHGPPQFQKKKNI
jgi:hypothetical protein